MAVTVIRRATSEDYSLLNERAEKFIARHRSRYPEFFDDLDMELSPYHRLDEKFNVYLYGGGWGNEVEIAKYLSRLWKAIFRRAVGESAAEYIAYGCIVVSEKN